MIHPFVAHFLSLSTDFKGRARERRVMNDLYEYNVGDGFCHAWYSRRFLQSVRVSEDPAPHSGLGLNSYVHWSSPIRRFGDLQVHACVKRFLRRKRVYELLQMGEKIPAGMRDIDLGLPRRTISSDGKLGSKAIYRDQLDNDVDYREGGGLLGAARMLQRQSHQYWLFEYIRRIHEEDPDRTYETVILGCVDPERGQYAIYVYELGFEYRFVSKGVSRLDSGLKIHLRVDRVSPRNGILNFVRAY